jgi:hypothetical protein
LGVCLDQLRDHDFLEQGLKGLLLLRLACRRLLCIGLSQLYAALGYGKTLLVHRESANALLPTSLLVCL